VNTHTFTNNHNSTTYSLPQIQTAKYYVHPHNSMITHAH